MSDASTIAASVAESEPAVSSEVEAENTGLAADLAAEPKLGDPIEEAVEEQKAKEVEEQERKEQDNFAKKFAALSHKEKELRQREAELEEKLKEFQNADTLREQLKQNPVKMLDEMGISYQDITEMVLNENSPTTEMLLKRMKDEQQAEIEKLRQEYMEDKKAEEHAKYEAVINDFQEEIVDFVNDNEDYEFIRAQDRVDLVYEVIELHHEDTGRILSIKEAADAVEQHLHEKAKELLKVKKLGVQLTEEEEQIVQDSEDIKSGNKSVTLSNDQTTQVPNRRERKQSREESLAEAAKLIRWTE